MRYQTDSPFSLMGSEVDLAIESILAKDIDCPSNDDDGGSSSALLNDFANSVFRRPPISGGGLFSGSDGGDLSILQDSRAKVTSLPKYALDDQFLPPLPNHALLMDPAAAGASQLPSLSVPSFLMNNISSCSVSQQPLLVPSMMNALPPAGGGTTFSDDDSMLLDFINLNLVDEVILEVIFDVHRSAKCGLLFLRKKASESKDQYKVVKNDGSAANMDIFGQCLSGSSNKLSKFVQQADCVCPECHQTTAACRFAPHLEKCMGMGRNSSRVARRRLAAASSSSSFGHFPKSLTSSLSTGSAATRSMTSSSAVGGGSDQRSKFRTGGSARRPNAAGAAAAKRWANDDDEEATDDSDWLSTRRKGSQAKKRFVTTRSTRKKVKNGVGSLLKKKQGSSSSLLQCAEEAGSISPIQITTNDDTILLSDLLDTPPLFQTHHHSLANGDGDSSTTSSSSRYLSHRKNRLDVTTNDNDFLDLSDAFDIPSPNL